MVVSAAGLAMMVPNLISMVGLAALVIAVELQVWVVEEPYLRAVHGSSFAAYVHRVGRFIPRVGFAQKS
jgi:protein-S-isoprenylcysteine O-methyltransferase Ste14